MILISRSRDQYVNLESFSDMILEKETNYASFIFIFTVGVCGRWVCVSNFFIIAETENICWRGIKRVRDDKSTNLQFAELAFSKNVRRK